MANKRIFYAVYQAGFSICGANTFTSAHGLQSVGVNTQFNLEQVFEIGQISIYENIENIPDIEITMEKVLDGYPPLYLLATTGASSASLSGRSNIKTTVGLSIYSDVQDSASGTPLTQCTASGMYISALNYNIAVQGNATESVTLVGNNKVWNNTFTATAFDNLDEPLAIAGSGGVNRREDIIFGQAAGASILPPDVYGVTSSGYVAYNTTTQEYGAHLQSIKVSTNLGREQLFELGRRGPYHRYVSFPVEVKCDIEAIDIAGDNVSALEESTANLTEREIYLKFREGLRLDLGINNKLSSVTWGGANAGQNGGNATATYSFSNFNDLDVLHPQDPTTALRP